VAETAKKKSEREDEKEEEASQVEYSDQEVIIIGREFA